MSSSHAARQATAEFAVPYLFIDCPGQAASSGQAEHARSVESADFMWMFSGFFHLRDPTSRVCRVKKDLSIRYVVMWPSRGMARFACHAQHIPAHSSSKFGCRANGNHRSNDLEIHDVHLNDAEHQRIQHQRILDLMSEMVLAV
jgi:hypothetical protein